jgi:hypothetical protein
MDDMVEAFADENQCRSVQAAVWSRHAAGSMQHADLRASLASWQSPQESRPSEPGPQPQRDGARAESRDDGMQAGAAGTRVSDDLSFRVQSGRIDPAAHDER